jgi:coenzyme PQQ precursor peptide PqqA
LAFKGSRFNAQLRIVRNCSNAAGGGFRWENSVVSRTTVIRQETVMKWSTPKVVEICVGMEINCYACAEL